MLKVGAPLPTSFFILFFVCITRTRDLEIAHETLCHWATAQSLHSLFPKPVVTGSVIGGFFQASTRSSTLCLLTPSAPHVGLHWVCALIHTRVFWTLTFPSRCGVLFLSHAWCLLDRWSDQLQLRVHIIIRLRINTKLRQWRLGLFWYLLDLFWRR